MTSPRHRIALPFLELGATLFYTFSTEDAMPTQLPRVQALFPPETYAKVRQISRLTRRSSSFTVVDLVEEVLKTDRYQILLEEAARLEGEVPVQEDPRTRIPQPRTCQPRVHKKETAPSTNWWEVA